MGGRKTEPAARNIREKRGESVSPQHSLNNRQISRSPRRPNTLSRLREVRTEIMKTTPNSSVISRSAGSNIHQPIDVETTDGRVPENPTLLPAVPHPIRSLFHWLLITSVVLGLAGCAPKNSDNYETKDGRSSLEFKDSKAYLTTSEGTLVLEFNTSKEKIILAMPLVLTRSADGFLSTENGAAFMPVNQASVSGEPRGRYETGNGKGSVEFKNSKAYLDQKGKSVVAEYQVSGDKTTLSLPLNFTRNGDGSLSGSDFLGEPLGVFMPVKQASKTADNGSKIKTLAGGWVCTETNSMQGVAFGGLEFMESGKVISIGLFGPIEQKQLTYTFLDGNRLALTWPEGDTTLFDVSFEGSEMKLIEKDSSGQSQKFQRLAAGQTVEQAMRQQREANLKRAKEEEAARGVAIESLLRQPGLVLEVETPSEQAKSEGVASQPSQAPAAPSAGHEANPPGSIALDISRSTTPFTGVNAWAGDAWCDDDPAHVNPVQLSYATVSTAQISMNIGNQRRPEDSRRSTGNVLMLNASRRPTGFRFVATLNRDGVEHKFTLRSDPALHDQIRTKCEAGIAREEKVLDAEWWLGNPGIDQLSQMQKAEIARIQAEIDNKYGPVWQLTPQQQERRNKELLHYEMEVVTPAQVAKTYYCKKLLVLANYIRTGPAPRDMDDLIDRVVKQNRDASLFCDIKTAEKIPDSVKTGLASERREWMREHNHHLYLAGDYSNSPGGLYALGNRNIPLLMEKPVSATASSNPADEELNSAVLYSNGFIVILPQAEAAHLASEKADRASDHQIADPRGDSQRVQLLRDSDKVIEDANKASNDAWAAIQEVLNHVDKLGLAAARAQKKGVAAQAIGLLSKSSEAYRAAEKKVQEAIARKKDDTMTPYLQAKTASYECYAQGVECNLEIVRLILDDAIPDLKTLLPRITNAAKRRDEARTKGAKISADAEASIKKLNGARYSN